MTKPVKREAFKSKLCTVLAPPPVQVLGMHETTYAARNYWSIDRGLYAKLGKVFLLQVLDFRDGDNCGGSITTRGNS